MSKLWPPSGYERKLPELRFCPLCGRRKTRDAYCDACATKAAEHRDGDFKCGRRWECGCVVCRGVRIAIGVAIPGDHR